MVQKKYQVLFYSENIGFWIYKEITLLIIGSIVYVSISKILFIVFITTFGNIFFVL